VLLGAFAEVPDVAVAVLGVPVVGVLGDLAGHRDRVADHRGRDAGDVAVLVGLAVVAQDGAALVAELDGCGDESGYVVDVQALCGVEAEGVGCVDIRGSGLVQSELGGDGVGVEEVGDPEAVVERLEAGLVV
jgi:hypothetical protein